MTAAIIFIPLVTAPMKTAIGLVIIVFTATPYYLIVVVWRKIPASLNHFSGEHYIQLGKTTTSNNSNVYSDFIAAKVFFIMQNIPFNMLIKINDIQPYNNYFDPFASR